MNRVLMTVREAEKKKDAGFKAKEDIQKILVDWGYNLLPLTMDNHSKFKKIKLLCYDIPHLFKRVGPIDELILQYPVYSRLPINTAIINAYRRNNSRGSLILVIHDIESLRLFEGEKSYLAKEIWWLNQADGLVVHTGSMKRWLEQRGVVTPMVQLNLFDYLSNQPLIRDKDYMRTVCFAGNLAKSSFLKKMHPKNYCLDVYGPNPYDSYPEGVLYRGAYSPDVLPYYLNYNFGLVWDGGSLEKCDGKFGEYMRYNSAHKISLYLSTGIPVIIWSRAAVADFILKNHLGIAVNSLNDLERFLNQMTANDYQQLKSCAVNFARQLRNGQRIKTALRNLETQLEKN